MLPFPIAPKYDMSAWILGATCPRRPTVDAARRAGLPHHHFFAEQGKLRLDLLLDPAGQILAGADGRSGRIARCTRTARCGCCLTGG